MILWVDWVQLSCSYSRWYWQSPQSPGLVTELEHPGCLIHMSGALTGLSGMWGWLELSLSLYVITRYFPLHVAFAWDPSSRSAGPLTWQLRSPQKHRKRACHAFVRLRPETGMVTFTTFCWLKWVIGQLTSTGGGGWLDRVMNIWRHNLWRPPLEITVWFQSREYFYQASTMMLISSWEQGLLYLHFLSFSLIITSLACTVFGTW